MGSPASKPEPSGSARRIKFTMVRIVGYPTRVSVIRRILDEATSRVSALERKLTVGLTERGRYYNVEVKEREERYVNAGNGRR